tara:strand:+ start:596 stop:1087 length:492 start_codon:yes stop_codon:yes gene_type:complete
MYPVCITRFNDITYNERKTWCTKHNFKGSIYGCPNMINSAILQDQKIIVLEMNNSINKIVGIGIIYNKLNLTNHRYKIYSDNNYNRYIYKSDKYIDISNLDKIDGNIFDKIDAKIIEQIELLLFKGKRNYKRGQGIQRIPLYIRELKSINIEHFINTLVSKLI